MSSLPAVLSHAKDLKTGTKKRGKWKQSEGKKKKKEKKKENRGRTPMSLASSS
jgi:hypothetical protein